ncbi:MAG: hypothetical protein IT433_07655 [Phycisphaerales bacterium]|nr:hypothetical protein [Phycisphaerales bacterium]
MTDSGDRIPDPRFGRPHVVLLGAGASLAAFPNGDRRGKRLPLMNNLIDVLELGSLLDRHGIAHKGVNFEALYSGLVTSGQHPDVIRAIEASVFSYFHGMRLPDHPTIYDHLVLSLRPKDFIATFNWDPFLEQAIQRNYVDRRVQPPHIACLHGCVSLGYCDRHKPLTFGKANMNCLRCGEEVKGMRLLYPVTQKNYNADPHTIAAWQDTQMVMRHAYLFTVFGYSAPTTDVEAVRLLKEAWGDPSKRELEQVEVIDIRAFEDLEKTWSPFVLREHWEVHHSFYHSWIARHPRRSCEAFFNATMMCAPESERPIPRELGFPELWKWYQPMIDQENEYEAKRAAEDHHQGVTEATQ